MIASLDFMLRVALIPRGAINHGDDKPSCIQSERYPIRGGLAEKAKACTSFVLYLNRLRFVGFVPEILRVRNFVNVMQIRERNEEGSIALKTLGKERDRSQSSI